MKSGLPSDRKKADLRGRVKTIVDDWSTTEFDREGRILEWRGNSVRGYTERKYSYDQNGKLIGITGSSEDQVDEFRYDEQGRMTQTRHVPARPEQRNVATGVEIAFEVIAEGASLVDGGTVETSYNESGQPVEKRIIDHQGLLLYRILHKYDANGRLAEERLITENVSFPKAFIEQIPSDQRAAVLAQLKTEMETAGQWLFGTAERVYLYNSNGDLTERHMCRGPIHIDEVWTFSPSTEMIELTKTTSGFPDELGAQEQLQWKCRYSYEYDDYGNWIKKTETWEVAGDPTSHTRVRHLTYYS